jgi:hypothetical protein
MAHAITDLSEGHRFWGDARRRHARACGNFPAPANYGTFDPRYAAMSIISCNVSCAAIGFIMSVVGPTEE